MLQLLMQVSLEVEAFVMGTAAGVVPVGKIEDSGHINTFENPEISSFLSNQLDAIKFGKRPAPLNENWLRSISN